MIELKPCPFCGGAIDEYNLEVEYGLVARLNVRCGSCGVDFEIRSSKTYSDNRRIYIKSAVDIWNRRAGND